MPETWARLTANPEDRRKAAHSYIESVGGRETQGRHREVEAPAREPVSAESHVVGSQGAR
jgi:hypothetical protein